MPPQTNEGTILTDTIVSSPITTEPTVPIQSHKLFTNQQIKTIYIILGSFLISMIGGLLAQVIPVAFILVYAWFFGVIAGVVIALMWVFGGIFTWRKNHGQMFYSGLLFIIMIAIVGTGSCAMNLSGMSFGPY